MDEGDFDMCSADLCQGTRAEGSKSPPGNDDVNNILHPGRTNKTENTTSYGLDCLNFRNETSFAFQNLSGQDPSNHDETLEGFDFGRNRSSIKRQRLFFRDRLASNNIQGNGNESLKQMKK